MLLVLCIIAIMSLTWYAHLPTKQKRRLSSYAVLAHHKP